MKLIAFSALCVVSIALMPQALACTCLCLDERTDPLSIKEREEQEIERAHYFFSGYILRREKPFRLQDLFGTNRDEAPVKVTIRPVEILKGAAAKEIVVWEDGPLSCHGALPVEEGFVKVLAYREDGRLKLPACSCTKSTFNRLAAPE